MYSDEEYDLENDLNSLDDLLEPVEHTTILQPSINDQTYNFNIPKNVKSIDLQFELDDCVLSKEDKDDILNFYVGYMFNSSVLILLTQQICRGYNIIEDDNNLIIPIFSFNYGTVSYSRPLSLSVPSLSSTYKKYKIKVIVKQHLKQSSLKMQYFINAMYSYKNGSIINEVYSGYLNHSLYFGMVFYISSKNENVNQPVIDSIKLKNIETGEEVEYTSENMLCIQIWDYHIYILSFIKEHSTIEKLISYIKNPKKIEDDAKEYGIVNKTTYRISDIKSLDAIDNNDIHCLKLLLRMYNV